MNNEARSDEMPNVEIQMTKEIRMKKQERDSNFDSCHSLDI